MRRVVSRVTAVLAAVLVMGMLGASPAQAQQAEGFGIQLIGGPLFANLTDVPEGISTDNKTGFLVGLALGGNRGGRVGVEGDVLYGQKGAKIAGFGDYAQHYVHVPVMLKVNIGQQSTNGFSFFGLGGGFFDWDFKGKLDDLDISESTDGFEVGWLIGGGFEILRFSGQVRYIRGVRQIDRNFEVGNSTESQSQSVALLFAFRLN